MRNCPVIPLLYKKFYVILISKFLVKRMIDIYDIKITIHGIHVIFGDADLTFYRILHMKDINELSEGEEPLFQLHSHSYYEFHVITSGNASFEVDGNNYRVKKGELFIIPPNAMHYAFRGNSNLNEIVIALTVNRTVGEEGFFEYFDSSLNFASLVPLELGESFYDRILNFHNMYDCSFF